MHPLIETFASMIESRFSFLINEFGFTFCGTMQKGMSDMRDAQLLVRYFRGNCVVDVVLDQLGLGFFVAIGRLPTSPTPGNCGDLNPTRLLSFEQFLLEFYEGELGPPLKGMGRHKVFSTMCNQTPGRYVSLISKHIPEAVSEMARRFREWGMPLVNGDTTFDHAHQRIFARSSGD